MPGESSSRTFAASLPARIRAHWQIKAWLAVLLPIFFCVPYLLIGHFPLLPVHMLPLTTVDRAIGFHPYAWVWIYQSIYLPMNLVPWLSEQRDQLLRYTKGFVILSLISFVIFVLIPIRAPKPLVPNPTGMYWLLLQYDAPLNSLPSLHAALLVYTLAYGKRVVGEQLPAGVKTVSLVWCVLILYGTLATKEHYVVDIIAGIGLAFLVDLWVWRRATVITPEPPPFPTAAKPLSARS